MLTLYTDTDTDITPVVAAEYGYKLISMPYSIDAKTVHPYVDFTDFDSRAFYDTLRSGVLPPPAPSRKSAISSISSPSSQPVTTSSTCTSPAR